MAWLLLSLRRLRDARATSVALMLTILVTAFVFAVAPRLLDAAATDTLREELRRAGAGVRNLQLLQDARFGTVPSGNPLQIVEDQGVRHALRIPSAVAALGSERSTVVDTPRWSITSRPLGEATLKLRIQTGAAERVTLREGRLPTGASREVEANDPPPLPALQVTALEAAVSTSTATVLGLAVGDTLVLRVDPSDRTAVGHADRLAVDIVGIFDVTDPLDDHWFDDPAIEHVVIRSPGPLVEIQDATALLSPDAYKPLYDATRESFLPLRYTWRLELDTDRFDAAGLPAVLDDARRLDGIFPRAGARPFNDEPVLRTGLLRLLEGQRDRWQSAETVLTVVALGPGVVALAALALVALLAAGRRRSALVLARGRGASLRQLVTSVGAEGLLLALPGVLLGIGLALLLVGRGPIAVSAAFGSAVGLAGAALLLLGSVPAAVRLARFSTGGAAGVAGGGAIAGRRPSPRRLVFEGLLVGMAILGVVLLRDRGVRGSSTSTTLTSADPLIAAVPALAGFATAVVAMRLFPIPMRLVAEVAAAGRGLVASLGVRRAMRGGATGIVLVVLLSATALAAFSSATLVHIARAGEAVAWLDVGASYRVGSTTGPLAEGLNGGALPGVSAAATGWTGVVAIEGKSTRITLVALDLTALESVTQDTPAALALPPDVLADDASAASDASGGAGAPSDGPPELLAVVSPTVTAPGGAPYALGDAIDARVGNLRVVLRVAGFAPRAPLVEGDQFAIVSRARLASAIPGRDFRPTGMLLRAGDGAATDLRAALATVSPALTLASRAEQTAAILDAPAVDALQAGIAVAALIAGLYAAVAVLAALALAGAARAGEIAHLRTLGLSRRQALHLMLIEQGPAVVVAFVGGVGLGLGLFVLLRPGLGLGGLLGASIDVPLAVEPLHLIAVLVAMSVIVGAGVWLGAMFQGGSWAARALRRGIE